MRAVICLIFAICVWAVALGESCKDGEVTNDGCNTCVCRNGVQACTLKLCFPKSETRPVKVRREAECLAGESKWEACNRCTCSESGRWACTEKACLGKRQVNECTPGESKKMNCNKCTCTQTGLWACTRRVCSPEETQESCKEGEVTNDGCNTCVCTNGVQACTYKLCHPKREIRQVRAKREAECLAGEKKWEDCNRCFCSKTGKWACTKKGCLSKRQVNQCTPGDVKQLSCNRCTCTQTGLWACTKRMCSPEEEQKPHIALFASENQRSKRDSAISEDLRDVPCAPNDFFKLDCNTCYCNLDRSGYLCTENICEKQEIIAEYHSTTSIPLRKGSRLLVFNERHEILRRIDTKPQEINTTLLSDEEILRKKNSERNSTQRGTNHIVIHIPVVADPTEANSTDQQDIGIEYNRTAEDSRKNKSTIIEGTTEVLILEAVKYDNHSNPIRGQDNETDESTIIEETTDVLILESVKYDNHSNPITGQDNETDESKNIRRTTEVKILESIKYNNHSNQITDQNNGTIEPKNIEGTSQDTILKAVKNGNQSEAITGQADENE